MNANSPALWTRFRGGWCDNCRTAFPYIPQHGCCPDCGPIRLRPATITVEPDDADEVLAAAKRQDVDR